ncbi:MAG: hypothetical protein PW734_01250 [Verrucomicrobium sp.]|nr:hypothetical protein [Verrucomicrobium sp.]
MFLAREGFLSALGFSSEPQFYQAVTENSLQPQTLALAVACGPFRQRTAGAQFLTVTNGAEPYIVVINADAERPLMTEALQKVFPGASIQSSLAAPTLQVFPILPPRLRQRFNAADQLRRKFILQFIASSTIACLLILLFMLARLPGWLSIVPLILPYAVFSRAKFELERHERGVPAPKKEETAP